MCGRSFNLYFQEKRLENELKKVLQALQPPLAYDAKWVDVKARIQNDSKLYFEEQSINKFPGAFLAIGDESKCERIFEDYCDALADACANTHGKRKYSQDADE